MIKVYDMHGNLKRKYPDPLENINSYDISQRLIELLHNEKIKSITIHKYESKLNTSYVTDFIYELVLVFDDIDGQLYLCTDYEVSTANPHIFGFKIHSILFSNGSLIFPNSNEENINLLNNISTLL